MKRVILGVWLVMLSLSAIAQTKAVRVESPIVAEKDFVWYVEQKEAWKAQTLKNPKDENACVLVGREQGRPHHHMVFGAVHVAEGLCHHLLDDLNWVSGRLSEAKPDDGVQPCCMAVVADIVPMDAAGLAALLLVADGTLHEFIVLEILQRSLTDQTFFFHYYCLFCQ